MKIEELLLESESLDFAPQAGDYFDIEINEEEMISTYIESVLEDGSIVLAGDDLMTEALEVGILEAKYHGREVPLGKPMKGDVKKSKVYVKNAKGNVVKVNFGDPNMRIKKSNPKRRKSFRARHNCKNPGPRTSARYWSCRAW